MKISRPDDSSGGTSLGNLTTAGQIDGVRQPRAAISFRDEHAVQTQSIDLTNIVPRELRGVVNLGRSWLDRVFSQLTYNPEKQGLLFCEWNRLIHAF